MAKKKNDSKKGSCKKTVRRKRVTETADNAKKEKDEISMLRSDLMSDNHPRMFEDEDSDHVLMESGKKNSLGSFYKRMSLKCMKCKKGFSSHMELEPLKIEVDCPECEQTHIVTFVPSSSLFSLHSSSLCIDQTDEGEQA